MACRRSSREAVRVVRLIRDRHALIDVLFGEEKSASYEKAWSLPLTPTSGLSGYPLRDCS